MLGLTPNRVAAISSVAADAGAAVTVLTGTLPTNLQTTAVLVAALLAKSGVVLKFLQGSQNWDAIAAGVATRVSLVPDQPPAAPVTLEAPNQPEQTYNGTAPDDPWPTVDPVYAPPVAGHPDQS